MRVLGALSLAVPVVLVSCAEPDHPPRAIAGADAQRGLELIRQTGCAACHDIAGVRWPKGRSGPALEGLASRPILAGGLPNQPDLMVAFLRDAPSLVPGTAMPPMPLSEEEARDIAAYLYSLEGD